MCHYIEKNKVIILLETSDKCKNDQNPTSKKSKATSQITKGRPNPLKETSKLTWQQAKWPIIMLKDFKPNKFSNITMVCELNLT
jgi:hypothetical protein